MFASKGKNWWKFSPTKVKLVLCPEKYSLDGQRFIRSIKNLEGTGNVGKYAFVLNGCGDGEDAPFL